MGATRLSAISVSRFDNTKLLVIISIAVITLTIESQISYIADFIPEQIGSSQGIAAFIAIWIIFTITQYYILAYVKQANKETQARALYFNTIHRVVIISQSVLAGVIGLVILQILTSQQYNTVLLTVAQTISYGLWIVTLGLLARALLSWYKLSNRNIMILIIALSMVAYVANGALGLAFAYDELSQVNPVIRSGDVAVWQEFSFTTAADFIDAGYTAAYFAAYILTWIGTVMLLRPYIQRIGKIKFYAIMGAAMIYYLIQFPLFNLGYISLAEETDADAMNNLLIFGLSAVITGIVFGAAFLSVARTLPKGTPLRNHMMIAAYGFVLFYVAGSAWMTQAAYPPYGLAAVSFTGLSSYLIYMGLYSSAVTVSQDMALRQSIRESVKEQSKFLDSMGTAQMDQQIQSTVMTVAKKASDILEEKSGIEASMTEDDMKDYMETVMNELKGAKAG